MFTTENTKLECYHVNFRGEFAALVLLDGGPLFEHGHTLADRATVTQWPNSYDDGMAVTSVSDEVWGNAARMRCVNASHQALVDYANSVDLPASAVVLAGTETANA